MYSKRQVWWNFVSEILAYSYLAVAVITVLTHYTVYFTLFHGVTSPRGPVPPHYLEFMITLRYTTRGETPLDEWSARRRDLIPDNTQHSQQTNIHAACGIRTHNLSRLAAADLRLRPRGHRDRLCFIPIKAYFKMTMIITKTTTEFITIIVLFFFFHCQSFNKTLVPIS